MSGTLIRFFRFLRTAKETNPWLRPVISCLRGSETPRGGTVGTRNERRAPDPEVVGPSSMSMVQETQQHYEPA
jgi:hypothetical protein